MKASICLQPNFTQTARRQPHRRERPPQRLRALPIEALDGQLSVAAAAVAASLLTAFWMHRADVTAAEGSQSSKDNTQEQPQRAAVDTAPPTSVEGIWAAAWQGFAPLPDQQQQQQPSAAGPDAAGRQAAPSDTRNSAQQAEEQQESEVGDGSSGDGGLQRTPVLLLQGIRSADRSSLLALCLAALEAQVAALPAGAGLLSSNAAQWRQLTTVLLALSSVASAAAWLGYVPEQLLEGAARKLRSADTAFLQAAGLTAAAEGVQRQAKAAAAASVAAEGTASTAARRDASKDADSGKGSDGSAVDWFCLEEKLQLYSSVLRLLTCSFIEQQQQGGLASPAGTSLPSPRPAAGVVATGAAEGGGAATGAAEDSTSGAHSPEQSGEGEQQAGDLAAGAGETSPARRQALLLLRRQQEQGGSLGGIRGWRATAAGTRSNSQLLALAPAVLQDMAVTAADAVAAAYLGDASTAGPTLAAAAAAAAVVPPSGREAEASRGSRDPAGNTAPASQEQQQQKQGEQHGSASGGGRWWQRRNQPASEAPFGSNSSTSSQADVLQPAASSAAVLGPSAANSNLGSHSKPSGSAEGSAGSTTNNSSGGSPLESGWWPTYVHAQLASTRQLQRFANRVALNRWVERNYRGVADIYEDRLRLFRIGSGGRSLVTTAAPMKRTPELGRLKGLRYAASLLLEAVDLVAPLLRTLWCRATSAASWLLVRTVGEAAALFRRGMQASSKGGPARQQGKQQKQAKRGAREPVAGGALQRGRQQQGSSGQQTGNQASTASWAWQP